MALAETAGALALSGLIRTGWGGSRRGWVVALAAAPMVGAGLDYLENLVRVALSSYPDVPGGLLTAQTTLTTLKLLLSYVSQGLAVLAIVLLLFRAIRTRV